MILLHVHYYVHYILVIIEIQKYLNYIYYLNIYLTLFNIYILFKRVLIH